MSADNYFLIRSHPSGGYAAVMGFASSDQEPEAEVGHTSFPTIVAAVTYAQDEYSEYGIVFHEELEEELDREGELDRIARAIVDSEDFMWLMAGGDPQWIESHLSNLLPAFDKYRELGGGYNAKK